MNYNKLYSPIGGVKLQGIFSEFPLLVLMCVKMGFFACLEIWLMVSNKRVFALIVDLLTTQEAQPIIVRYAPINEWERKDRTMYTEHGNSSLTRP